MGAALYIAQIIVSIMLIVLVILQARSPGLSSQGSSIHTTRRGAEKTMHQATVVLAGVFLLLALVTSLPLSIFT
jgi:preprotein translocase subunit SecG